MHSLRLYCSFRMHSLCCSAHTARTALPTQHAQHGPIFQSWEIRHLVLSDLNYLSLKGRCQLTSFYQGHWPTGIGRHSVKSAQASKSRYQVFWSGDHPKTRTFAELVSTGHVPRLSFPGAQTGPQHFSHPILPGEVNAR